MAYLISLVLLLPCARAGLPAPAGQLVPLRRNAYPVYASDASGEEYEPFAVAAMPLHSAVPVLRVFSPAGYRGKRRPAKRPPPETDLYAFDSSPVEHALEPVRYEAAYEPARYEPTRYETVSYEHAYEPDPPKRPRARDQYEDEAASMLVYARPNKYGGFSYRKPVAAAPAPAPRPREPVIIRIHKYRVVH